MKARTLFSKVVAGVLAVLMLVGVMPTFASAAETEVTPLADTNLDDLHLNKTVTLQSDGTYTVVLEGYATGDIQVTTVQQVVPTDIILVLDQSGSMEQNSMANVADGTYTQATPTNAELADTNNFYYYQVGDEYFRLTATVQNVTKEVRVMGDDGVDYTGVELGYSWTRPHDGQVYYTARPFVASTLTVWTRHHSETNLGFTTLQTFWYENGNGDKNGGNTNNLSASAARETLEQYYTGNYSGNTNDDKYANYTVEFNSDHAPGTSTTDDDPYYVAANYMAVTETEVYSTRYVYSYTDSNGNVVEVGNSGDATFNDISGTAANISPVWLENSGEGTRMQALQYAAYNFIDSIRESALASGADHRVAIVGFASTSEDSGKSNYHYQNSELFIGADQYNYDVDGYNSTYNQDGQLADDMYTQAFQNVLTTTGYNNLYASIGALEGEGATFPDVGFKMANGIMAANPAEYVKEDGVSTGTRARVIIFLTDGQPGQSGYDDDVATDALTEVATAETTYGATIHTVAILDSSDLTTNMTNFLNQSDTDGAYTLAEDADDLKDFFGTIEGVTEEVTTTVTLSENAFIVDRISEYFYVPEDFVCDPYLENGTTTNVTIAYARHLGNESFAEPVLLTKDSGVTAHVTLGQTDGLVHGVTVQDHAFLGTNMVDTTVSDSGSVTATGNKIVITITGLLAKDEAALNTYVNTNHETSGVWDGTAETGYGCVKAFPMPTKLVQNEVFVLDYAKGASLPVFTGGPAAKFDEYYTESNRDQASTDTVTVTENAIFNKVGDGDTSFTGAYGISSIGEDGSVVYTPTTTKWDGYDTFYVLGTDTAVGDTSTHYSWAKVSVIPANNVYYEDTFISTAAGTVGITYTGDWTEVTSGSNAEDANDGLHGWIEDLANETDLDSDGTIHSSSTMGASATFSFTGTGFDVYSRTNMTSGKVFAHVTWKEPVLDENGEETGELKTRNYGLFVDTVSESGEYYQIPTLWYNGEGVTEGLGAYREYTVTIHVQSNAEGEYAYCIDGIRIYNPMDPEQTLTDPVVGDAYGDELGAMFMSVRDLLLDQNSLDKAIEVEDDPETEEDETVYFINPDTTVDGLVFIDTLTPGVNDPDPANNSIGIYTDYGPKNEVYIAPGHAIAFRVDEGLGSYQIGLKSPTGDDVSVLVSNGNETAASLTVSHTADMYYSVTSNSGGYIVIRNNSAAVEGDPNAKLLSVTKLKLLPAPVAEVSAFSLRSSTVGEMVAAVDAFDAMPVVAYSMEPEDTTEPEDSTEPETPTEPEDSTEPETPTEPEDSTEAEDTTEPEDSTEPETPTEPENKPNLEIQNPTEPEDESDTSDIQERLEAAKAFVSKIFSGLRGLFGR